VNLKKVRVQNFKSVEDSGWVDIGDVTCLVGKNEAGKTAFLQALHRLKPTRGTAEFDETMDYPSRHYSNTKGAETRRREPPSSRRASSSVRATATRSLPSWERVSCAAIRSP
jgi:ABC-type cobalamin/Fe3+-siderophores transport system ATPase subunit